MRHRVTNSEQILHDDGGILVGFQAGDTVSDDHATPLHKRHDAMGHFIRKQPDVEENQNLVSPESFILHLLFVQHIEFAKGAEKQFVGKSDIPVFLLKLYILRAGEQETRLCLHLWTLEQAGSGFLNRAQPLAQRFPMPRVLGDFVSADQEISSLCNRRQSRFPFSPVLRLQFWPHEVPKPLPVECTEPETKVLSIGVGQVSDLTEGVMHLAEARLAQLAALPVAEVEHHVRVNVENERIGEVCSPMEDIINGELRV